MLRRKKVHHLLELWGYGAVRNRLRVLKVCAVEFGAVRLRSDLSECKQPAAANEEWIVACKMELKTF
jgi:hypothetical protein